MEAKISDQLVFLPLGGCNEIGMNLNAYGYGSPIRRRWIIVDMGVTFGDNDWSGIDLICADPTYLSDKHIDAIFLTHAHEDHIGAVALLANAFESSPPIYATPFTAYLANRKLEEADGYLPPIEAVRKSAIITAGPFEVSYIRLTHSIPEPSALAITTPLGTIFHTGDWKIDPEPIIGKTIDERKLQELGDNGILAMVCDSTNVFEDGEAGSESTVAIALEKLIAKQKGRVAVTTFASNVARVKSVFVAARKAGRKVCLIGRSMRKIYDAATRTRVMERYSTVNESTAANLPPNSVLYLCTGSQGESRAALARITEGKFKNVKLDADDTVVFSSRVIPGNEEQIFALQNALADQGIKVITDSMMSETIHVSGHPCRDELQRMYGWIKPQISVPVHGERRHVIEHARFAKSLQVPKAITPRNGEMVRLAPKTSPVEIIETVHSGRLYKDGTRLVPADSHALFERRNISRNGYIHISAVLNHNGHCVNGPYITIRGLVMEENGSDSESYNRIEESVTEAFDKFCTGNNSGEQVYSQIIKHVRHSARDVFGKKPFVDITFMDDLDYD